MTATTDNNSDAGNALDTATTTPPRPGFEAATPTTAPHVVIIVQNLPVPLDRRVWLECRALRAAGYEVSVVCPKGEGDPSYHVIDGVHIYKYEPPPDATGTSGFAYEFAYCFARTAALITKVARRRKIDAVQACNPPDTFFALAAPMKALTGARFVFDQHDLCPEVYASRFAQPSRFLLRSLLLLEQGTYKVADHVISTNESFKRIAMARGSRDADDVTVVRSGPRASNMRRQEPEPALKNGRRYLCSYLGIMGPQDGVDILVRAADELVNKRGRDDIQFALMGFGDCFDEIKELTTELGLDDYIELTGRADDTMISRYLSTADLGLSPDPKNEMNDLCTMNKTLEYMAFELPVVTFDLQETRVSAGDAALYAKPNDIVAFADGIEELLADDEQREAMGTRGRNRIEEALSWEHSARHYVSVYDRLLRS